MSASDILNRRLSRFQTQSTSVSHFADKLRELGFKICTLENLADEQAKSGPLIDHKDATLRQLLDEVVEQHPGYRWEAAEKDLINIFPIESVLNSETSPLDIKKKGLYLILKEEMEIERRGISLFIELEEGDGPLIDVSVESANLRKALNAIVRQLTGLIWHISGNPGAYYLTLSVVSES